MKGVDHRDDFMPFVMIAELSIPSRQLNGRLIGFCPAVTKEDLVHAGMVDELLRQLRLGLTVVEIGDMAETLGLFLKGDGDTGVTVPKVGDCNPADEIQVFLSIGIIDSCPSPFDDHYRQTSISIHDIAIRLLNDFFCGQGIPSVSCVTIPWNFKGPFYNTIL